MKTLGLPIAKGNLTSDRNKFDDGEKNNDDGFIEDAICTFV